MSGKLQQAIDCIKAGDRQQGKRLLAEVLIQDPGQEIAWLLMAEIVDYDEHRRYCLEQVLRLNPSNQPARNKLASLQQDDESRGLPEQPPAVRVASLGDGGEAEQTQVAQAPGAELGADIPVQERGSQGTAERAQRGNLVILAVAALIAVWGVAVFVLTAPAILAFALDPRAHLLDAPDILQSLLLMVLGASLTIAGLIGIWWALWPSSGRPLDYGQNRGTRRRGRKAQENPLDAGLWLDTGNVDEQETGIRLL
jgi:hypothetical protein